MTRRKDGSAHEYREALRDGTDVERRIEEELRVSGFVGAKELSPRDVSGRDQFHVGGAEAFRRDIPGAIIRFFDTGHFALETHAKEIAAMILDFFAR